MWEELYCISAPFQCWAGDPQDKKGGTHPIHPIACSVYLHAFTVVFGLVANIASLLWTNGALEGGEKFMERRQKAKTRKLRKCLLRKSNNQVLIKKKKRKPTVICSSETGFAVAGMLIRWDFPSSFPCGAFWLFTILWVSIQASDSKCLISGTPFLFSHLPNSIEWIMVQVK